MDLLFCSYILAGDESDGWHPLVKDFILIGRKLERLGFMYSKDGVIVIEPKDAYEL